MVEEEAEVEVRMMLDIVDEIYLLKMMMEEKSL
jgi:hypothetical protein